MNIKYFWINIDKSVDRRLFMEEQFKQKEIDNQRISAVTPDKLIHILEDKPPYYCGNECCLHNNCNDCKFEYSCTCSHLDAIKEGYKSGADYFVVCEDDIYFPFKIDWDKLIRVLPQDFDIAQLMVLDENGNQVLYDYYKKNQALFISFDPSKRLFSTGMYLISRRGAKKLLNLCINKKTLLYDFSAVTTMRQADFFLYMNVNTYTSTFPFCYPALIFISEIHPHHYILHKHSIDKILSIINENQLMHPFVIDYYPMNDFMNHYKALLT